MKDENAFNAYLSRQLKKLAPATYMMKLSEKYHVGVADFQLVRRGQLAVFESKFIPKAAVFSRGGRVLKHPFTGPQLTFLKGMARAGARTYGVVGMADIAQMRVVPSDQIPETGNWTLEEWGLFRHGTAYFDLGDVKGFARHLFDSEAGHGP